MRAEETEWLETLRADVQPLLADLPEDAAAFSGWFAALKDTGPGQYDPLFDWLAGEADEPAMKWFLTQEAAGEAGFEDLVALAQIKVPVNRAKLELANNYWDEMGRGNEAGMHGPMLAATVRAYQLEPAIGTTIWPSLALANTLTGLATNRDYALHAIGALGAVELTAPTRVARVAEGLKRLGAPPVARKYFHLHAVLDVKHAEDWIANVLDPLVAHRPEWMRPLAEGALMRLLCGQRCFEAYRAQLWPPKKAAA